MANVLFSRNEIFIEPLQGLLIYSFLHSFTTQTFIKHPGCARHCVQPGDLTPSKTSIEVLPGKTWHQVSKYNIARHVRRQGKAVFYYSFLQSAPNEWFLCVYTRCSHSLCWAWDTAVSPVAAPNRGSQGEGRQASMLRSGAAAAPHEAPWGWRPHVSVWDSPLPRPRALCSGTARGGVLFLEPLPTLSTLSNHRSWLWVREKAGQGSMCQWWDLPFAWTAPNPRHYN